jgi:cyclopropane fatty-acyl-phospholipid synthase-like methyltransferase
MEEKINRDTVVNYYDEHVKFKVNDYIVVNPRIEGAWQTLINRVSFKPARILEVGCGIGSICNKMHKRWPDAVITGIDISTQSVAIATKLFANDKVNFIETLLTPETFNEQFDLIIFMDVYEHIAVEDRPAVHGALNKLLRNKGRIFLSVPTPQNLKWCLINRPETMQPVDEHISFEVIGKLAADTGTEVQLYDLKSIWRPADYAHIVLEKNNDFTEAFNHPKPVTTLQRANRVLSKIKYKITKPLRSAFVRKKLK